MEGVSKAMPATPQNSFSSSNASALAARRHRKPNACSRAAALVSVTNRLDPADVPRLLEAAGKAIGRLASLKR
jgi:hypothetical protein